MLTCVVPEFVNSGEGAIIGKVKDDYESIRFAVVVVTNRLILIFLHVNNVYGTVFNSFQGNLGLVRVLLGTLGISRRLDIREGKLRIGDCARKS